MKVADLLSAAREKIASVRFDFLNRSIPRLCDYNSNYVTARTSMEIKLRKVGNSIGTSFPKEVLDRLGLTEGDTMNLVVTDDGIQLIVRDPNFDKVMAAYKSGAAQYRNAMRELADG